MWLLASYASSSRKARPTEVVMSRLEVEVDEMGSVVQKPANKPGVWIVIEAKTRQSLALHVEIGVGSGGTAVG
jgi:hypothetical protein